MSSQPRAYGLDRISITTNSSCSDYNCTRQQDESLPRATFYNRLFMSYAASKAKYIQLWKWKSKIGQLLLGLQCLSTHKKALKYCQRVKENREKTPGLLFYKRAKVIAIFNLKSHKYSTFMRRYIGKQERTNL